ncbi:MAG: LysR family transcriptional regulator [Oceanospirillales bacterium]|uniref:DNA-binding transcriptional LysR family regulator n=1 Tax=Marinobacterium halophilum TaxID=267374 RepID=A0A2P8EIM6_9GAMM|nr:LysR family transcriptional regulator [Marinobacterium halophilum]MBR9827130.1 LysR family transcriptional regulator [Oceanospirillales bacterium]PSL09281.1 DNA-binding transcriptional LysR family regulator [Marinobacterium halophilum]
MNPISLIDTHALSCFVTLAEADSLTDAAGRLNVTQSAVSQMLKQLESQLGTPLVIRRTRPLRLTAAGLVLKQHADTIIGDLRRLTQSVRDAAQQGLTQCRLGLVTSCSEVFGSRLIAQMDQRIEQLTLRSGLTPSLVQSFLNREVDILVSNDPLDDIEGLERHTLFRDPLLLALPDSFAFSHHLPPRDALAVLAHEHSLIRYGRNTHIGAMTEVALRRMGVLTQVRYETDDTHTLMNFVRDGHSWGIISALCLAQVLPITEGIQILPLDNSRHARQMHLLARQNELGDIPAEIARHICQLMTERILQQLQIRAPWLSGDVLATN